jgi:hypothetical protein
VLTKRSDVRRANMAELRRKLREMTPVKWAGTKAQRRPPSPMHEASTDANGDNGNGNSNGKAVTDASAFEGASQLSSASSAKTRGSAGSASVSGQHQRRQSQEEQADDPLLPRPTAPNVVISRYATLQTAGPALPSLRLKGLLRVLLDGKNRYHAALSGLKMLDDRAVAAAAAENGARPKTSASDTARHKSKSGSARRQQPPTGNGAATAANPNVNEENNVNGGDSGAAKKARLAAAARQAKRYVNALARFGRAAAALDGALLLQPPAAAVPADLAELDAAKRRSAERRGAETALAALEREFWPGEPAELERLGASVDASLGKRLSSGGSGHWRQRLLLLASEAQRLEQKDKKTWLAQHRGYSNVSIRVRQKFRCARSLLFFFSLQTQCDNFSFSVDGRLQMILRRIFRRKNFWNRSTACSTRCAGSRKKASSLTSLPTRWTRNCRTS